jgi:hypothetical protein
LITLAQRLKTHATTIGQRVMLIGNQIVDYALARRLQLRAYLGLPLHVPVRPPSTVEVALDLLNPADMTLNERMRFNDQARRASYLKHNDYYYNLHLPYQYPSYLDYLGIGMFIKLMGVIFPRYLHIYSKFVDAHTTFCASLRIDAFSSTDMKHANLTVVSKTHYEVPWISFINPNLKWLPMSMGSSTLERVLYEPFIQLVALPNQYLLKSDENLYFDTLGKGATMATTNMNRYEADLCTHTSMMAYKYMQSCLYKMRPLHFPTPGITIGTPSSSDTGSTKSRDTSQTLTAMGLKLLLPISTLVVTIIAVWYGVAWDVNTGALHTLTWTLIIQKISSIQQPLALGAKFLGWIAKPLLGFVFSYVIGLWLTLLP